MPLTPEVAQLLGLLQQLTGNNLSSVAIERTASGKKVSYVKVYHEDPIKAQAMAELIDNDIRSKP